MCKENTGFEPNPVQGELNPPLPQPIPSPACEGGYRVGVTQRVLLQCGLKHAREIDLFKPTRHGARRAPLFRISAVSAARRQEDGRALR